MDITNAEIVYRVLITLLFSAILGYEREHVKRPAGLRTHMLIGVGATLITLTSLSFPEQSEPMRLASGIITGIGFLGAGTIFRDENKVRGLTTAASLWATAGLGIATGVGHYFLAFVGFVAIFFILELRTISDVLYREEERFLNRRKKDKKAK
ncbi:MAG: MgtC/SapB family protein [Candidatus Altiarchaeota archaeon]